MASDRLLKLMYMELTMVASSWTAESFASECAPPPTPPQSAASLGGSVPLNSRKMQGLAQLFRLASSIRMVNTAAERQNNQKLSRNRYVTN